MLTIVLLPGMDGTGDLFEPFRVAMGDGFRLMTVAYPAEGARGYDALADIARAALPKDGDFIILGESFSGPIAITLAAERPAGLVGLVLCCTFARNPRPAFSPFRFAAAFLPVKWVPAPIFSHFLLGCFRAVQLLAAFKAAMSQVSADALRARINAVLAVDVSARLAQVNVPVLYLVAAQDRVVPPGASAHIAALCPATEVRVLEAPHFLLQVAPAQAANLVRQFAARRGFKPGA